MPEEAFVQIPLRTVIKAARNDRQISLCLRKYLKQEAANKLLTTDLTGLNQIELKIMADKLGVITKTKKKTDLILLIEEARKNK
jgi:hypothetical protein